MTAPKPEENDIRKVSDAIDFLSKSWKVSSLRSCVFYAEVQAICSIHIALESKADSLVWHFEPKGDYLVKSGHKIAREKVSNMLSQIPVTSFQPSKKIWKLIWALKIPPKLKHFW